MVLDDHKQREGIVKCRDVTMVENSGVAIGRSQQQGGDTVGSRKSAVNKPLKRKRASIDEHSFLNDRETTIAEYRRELDDLFELYKELSGCNLKIEDGISRSNNSLIACLLEESSLPYSKLVEELYGKLKVRGGFTLASVRSAVLSVGQRSMYGITSADADVLEDDSVSCLWCWETRDLKLLNPTQRGILNIRRIGRKRIHERISAISETLSALSAPENGESYKSIISNASVKLMKTLNGLEIRSLIEKLKQKNGADIAEKVTKQKEKQIIKEMEKNKQSAEKKNQKKNREFQKEILQSEKELKKLQEEAEKEERRREKEAAEEQKLLKKQQEEAERDQRRREKAEADLKKKLSIQKQATLMERFLKTKRSNSSPDNTKKTTSLVNRGYGSPCNVELVSATTSYMDKAFSHEDSLNIEDLHKVHVVGWHKLSSYNRSCSWGIRRKPKTELFKELKLQGLSSEAKPLEKVETPKMAVVPDNMDFRREPCSDKLVDGSEISFLNDNVDIGSPSIPLLRRKLLQFDKSNRPAYYGTWRKHRQ
ncbi:chromatin assembly factor 1 subunit FSM [Iris pallida]|uniref:Chromatin assembly factor 1 subunit FSM n=1 Tax=Iris pallida TaxID=29817 RepID=A0AAX6DJV0_IRIPA|nr:chromatin assembly factor 1 subunit FSM [Iris pallida]